MDSKSNQSESDGEHNDVRSPDNNEDEKSNPHTGDGASPGKIFIGGLAKETSIATFTKYFGRYGEMTDSVIMKDRRTGQPRGFGFVTYADPSVVDKVIQETHVINGKQVEIKRTIPKGAPTASSKDFKTKKIFVGGIPTTLTDEEFKGFFLKFGEVKEHEILRDRATSRSRGFGFITFETEKAVDDLLTKGNKVDLAGVQVEIKKAEPKKPDPPARKHFSDPRPAYGGGGFGNAYGGGFGAGAYRSGGGLGGRAGGYGGYGGNEFGSGYGGYAGSVGAYREPSLGYSSRYGGGFGRGYESGPVGGYGGPSEGYGGYGSGGYGSSYDAGLGAGFGGSGGGLYGPRAGYGGSGTGRYHPYAR